MTKDVFAPRKILTERLVLRPSCGFDAERAFEIQADWAVARMLRQASFPPDRAAIDRWFDAHGHQWRSGEAFRFAVEHDGRLIGITDIDQIARGEAELGYWFERASWGRGYATEAARAVVRFAFEDLCLLRLRAGHASDNLASRRVLLKLGFRPADHVRRQSRSRGKIILYYRYVIDQPKSGRWP